MLRPASPIPILAFLVLASSAVADVVGYSATYDVYYKGRRAGESTFTVSAGAEDNRYVFESRTRVKGLLRLVSPKPAVDSSQFRLDGNALKPLRFAYEDGSRKGEDNVVIEFDWAEGNARTTGEKGVSSQPLAPGTLDRGTMQVQLMRDLGAGRTPGPYVLIDEDGLKTYEYEEQAPEPIDTEIGRFDARKFVQRRQGSSRLTMLWVVPELDHVSARIEQWRDGEVNTVFEITSYTPQ